MLGVARRIHTNGLAAGQRRRALRRRRRMPRTLPILKSILGRGLAAPACAYFRAAATFAMSALAFFFSSRRRHTRSLRDWSSDVCSSDLPRAREILALWPKLRPDFQ